MAEAITKDEILAKLRGKITYGFGQSDLARVCGVSQAYISEVLAGRKQPSEKILTVLNVEKVTVVSFVDHDA